MANEGKGTNKGQAAQAPSYIIKRPRLTKLLDESEARIILLVAPAGYGKTTLAREWLAGKPGVAWYAGRPAMADVAVFASELAECLCSSWSLAAELVDRMRLLAAHDHAPTNLAKAISLAARGDARRIVVIDDYHHVAAGSQADAFMRELIASSDFRFVLASRVRPASVPPRTMVYGEALAVGTEALAFTDAETRHVLECEGSSQDPTPLFAEARGWPAVIALAARRGGIAGIAATDHANELYDYFAADLLRTVSPELAEGLFLLALGADASHQIAVDVLGKNHNAILDAGADRGFLTRSPAGEISIHPLIRHFLISRLRSERDLSERAVSTVTTALAQHRRWDECLAALKEFPRDDLIVATLHEALDDLLSSGRIEAIKTWLELAQAREIATPLLLVAEAEVALRDRNITRAQALAERGGDILGEGDLAARSYLIAARAAHLREDSEAVVRNCDLAHALATSDAIRFEASRLALMQAIEAHATNAAALFERLWRLPTSQPEQVVQVSSARALIALDNADPCEAERICELTEGLMTGVRDPLVRTNFLNLYGYVSVVRCRYERATDIGEQQLVEARRSGLEFAADYSLVYRAGALTGLRQFRLAQQALAELERRSDPVSDNIAVNATIYTARLKIAVGDLDGARIALARPHVDSKQPGLIGELLGHRALVAASMGDTASAERFLRELEPYRQFFEPRFIGHLARAVLLLQGEESAATANVLDVIQAGYYDAVVVACRAFPALASAVANDEASRPLLASILTKSRDIDLGRRAGLEMPRELKRSEGLSPRERQVHELLAQGRSNREIANTLFISESTAKVHVRHILEKLGVHTRTEAAQACTDGSSP